MTSKAVQCDQYGLPQTRKRLILVASKLGPIDLIKPTLKIKSVRDVIASQPRLRAGEIDDTDPFHRASSLNVLNLKRIKASRPGGSWRDWPKELVADCHRRHGGKTYVSVYGRMEWDKPSPTITTQYHGYGNGRFGHPDQDRAISLREGALLQGFPRRYKFVEPGTDVCFSHIGRLIGNAVPPLIGKIIGKTFLEHLKSNGIN